MNLDALFYSSLFSAGGQDFINREPLYIDDLTEEAARITAQWPGIPKINIVDTIEDVPFQCNPKARGIYHAGEVYIVANKIFSINDLQTVMAHECTMHYTLFEMMDGYEYSKLHAGIQKMKERGDDPIKEIAARIHKNYGKLTPHEETAEIFAHAGEACLDKRGNVKVQYAFMKEAFAGVASFLRDRGIHVRFTNFELQGIISRAGSEIQNPDRCNYDRMAKPSGQYSGKILDVHGNKVIQKIGRSHNDVVVHDLDKFEGQPLIGDTITIQYKNGKPSVSNRGKDTEIVR